MIVCMHMDTSSCTMKYHTITQQQVSAMLYINTPFIWTQLPDLLQTMALSSDLRIYDASN